MRQDLYDPDNRNWKLGSPYIPIHLRRAHTVCTWLVVLLPAQCFIVYWWGGEFTSAYRIDLALTLTVCGLIGLGYIVGLLFALGYSIMSDVKKRGHLRFWE